MCSDHIGHNYTQWSVTQHCYALYVYAIASYITNKNLKSLDKYNLSGTLWTMPLKETRNYRNTSIVARHIHHSICGKLSTITTSYVSLQGYEAIFPLFLSNICRKNSILQSVMHPNINSHNLAWWVEWLPTRIYYCQWPMAQKYHIKHKHPVSYHPHKTVQWNPRTFWAQMNFKI